MTSASGAAVSASSAVLTRVTVASVPAAAVIGVVLLVVEPIVLRVRAEKKLPLAERFQVEPDKGRGKEEQHRVNVVASRSSFRNSEMPVNGTGGSKCARNLGNVPVYDSDSFCHRDGV